MLTSDLRYFLDIAQTGSLRRAALLSDVSQPAVTKGLRRLEAELGLTLVQRSPKGAVLTEVGRAFLDRAGRLVRDADAAIQEANELRAAVLGLVRVGVTPALVAPLFDTPCMTLLEQRPTARVRVRIGLVEELLTALRRSEIDLMISGIPQVDPEEVAVRPLGESRLYVLARTQHPLFARRRLRLADFTHCAWMLPRRGQPARDWIDGVFVAALLPRPQVRLEFDTTHDGLMPLLQRTDLLTVAGEWATEHWRPLGIVAFALEALQCRREVAVLTRTQTPQSPVVGRFIELLLAQLQAPAQRPSVGPAAGRARPGPAATCAVPPA